MFSYLDLLYYVRAGLGVLDRPLDGRLELVPIDGDGEVDELQVGRWRECLLVAVDVAVARAGVGRVDVEVDWWVR